MTDSLNCPVCKADNATGPNCRRCKVDLSMLYDLEAARSHHISLAKAAAENGDFDTGLEELISAAELRDGPDLARFRACICLLSGDFDSALSEYVTLK